MSEGKPPGLNLILETVLYCRNDTEEETHRFYNEVMGMAESGYRVGSGILLIFNADRSANQAIPPPHGTTGPAHICFLAGEGDYLRWRDRIAGAGIEIIEDIEWNDPLRGQSFYFLDPAGNVLEIADRDIWPKEGIRRG